MASLFEKEYQALAKELGVTNPHAVPHVTSVVVNVGVGKQRDNKAFIEAVQKDLALITGQKPHERLARKAISGFVVRQGNLVGYRVTLRGKRMADFVRRFVHVTLPRVRDFRGVAVRSLDGHGNLSVGLREHLAFPEIHADKTDFIFGVQATFVSTAKDNAEGEALFRALGFPLTREDVSEAEVPTRRAAAAKKN